MSRNLTGGMVTELTAFRVRPVLFAEVEFASGFVRFWTGIGDIVWDSKTWTGAGNLLAISAAAETAEIRVNGIVVSLSGINSALLSSVLSQSRQSKPVRCWLGFLDADDNVIIDPYQFFKGKVDVPSISAGAETSTVSIAAENELIELRRARPRRFTREDQIIDFPDDKGFNFVPFIQNWNGQWGSAQSLPRIGVPRVPKEEEA